MTNDIRHTPLYRSVEELKTYIVDRDYYMDLGYTWEQASLRSYDHMFVNRKAARGGYNG